jgi:hypothetical protein
VEEDGRPPASGDPSDPPVETIAWDQQVEPAPPVAGEHPAAMIAALADPETRSQRPDTCPFLRTIDAAGSAVPPIEAPDLENRCVAVGEPTPQSGRQQQLVCLTSGHVNCPLYLRGALVAADALAPGSRQSGPSTAVVASVLLLIAAAAMSVGFLLVRGGFDLPAAAALPSNLALGPTPSDASSTSAPPEGAAPPPASPSIVAPPPTAEPSTALPPPPPTPTPALPTPAPARAPTPAPTSDRYLLLVPCPSTSNCWVYTVRRGDNLRSIASYFGVPYDTVLRMNPQIRDPTTITAGDRIRMPPPTR